MSTFLRSLRRRHEHISYFVICFFLIVPGVALQKTVGWWAVITLWGALVFLLELVYRWIVGVGNRNRRAWWARPHKPGYWSRWGWPLYLGVATVSLMIHYPFLRYASLLLLAGGVLSAGVIRWVNRNDQL